MLKIKKRYVVNDRNEPIAVQLDLETFNRIERALEDLALGRSIAAVADETSLDRTAARKRYSRLKKSGSR